jgi:hypothetical protein
MESIMIHILTVSYMMIKPHISFIHIITTKIITMMAGSINTTYTTQVTANRVYSVDEVPRTPPDFQLFFVCKMELHSK